MARATAYLYLVITMLLWSAALVVARGVHETAPPLALAFWRWLGAALAVAPFALSKLRSEFPATPGARFKVFGMCGLMVVANTLAMVAMSYTTAINATVINATQPAVTALIGFAILAERISWLQLLGIVAAFAGILVMAFQASLGALLLFSINSGDLIMLAAVCFWSCYAVALHHGVRVPSPAVLLFLMCGLGTVGVLPLYVMETLSGRPFTASWQNIGAAVFHALGATLLALYLWNAAIRSVGANRAAVFLNLIPVFGVALAVGFLGERMFAYHLVGAGLVISGIFMAVGRSPALVQPLAEADHGQRHRDREQDAELL